MDYSFILVLSHLQVLLQGLWFSLLIITIRFGITIFKTDLHRFNTRGTTINNNKLHQLPPGPKPWPIVGNLPTMLANKPTFRWINALMKEMNTEIACIRLGNVHVIPVTCPAIAREFLRKQDATFASRPLTMSTDVISSGYLTTTVVPFGEQWKKMRRIISSGLFSTTKHQWLHAKRTEEADRLVFHVYNECNNNNVNGAVNVRDAARHYCCNVIKRLCFNRTWIGKGSRNEEVEHLEALFTLLKHIYAFSVSDYVPNCLRGLDLDGHQAKVKEALRIVNKYHDPIIEERIREWNKNNDGDYQDFLDILISLKDSNSKPTLTLHEIKAQITELMLATVDNPSNAIEWALAEMINQPELLKRATEELDNVVGKERLVQESDIPKLKYVKACAREAFRLHPIVPFNLPHLSTKDTIVANYLIPKGSHVLLSRRELGRNSKVWNQPNKFDPERHLLNNNDVVLREPDLRFISFSTGTRGCPGIMLGTTMTIMLFARLLHGFTWTTPPNVSTINLAESHADAFLAEPLMARAKPRLPVQLYVPAD